MPPARLCPHRGILDDELCELQKIGNSPGVLQLLIELISTAREEQVFPELVTQFTNLLLGALESRRIAGHSAVVPHDLAQPPVEAICTALSANRKEPLGSL